MSETSCHRRQDSSGCLEMLGALALLVAVISCVGILIRGIFLLIRALLAAKISCGGGDSITVGDALCCLLISPICLLVLTREWARKQQGEFLASRQRSRFAQLKPSEPIELAHGIVVNKITRPIPHPVVVVGTEPDCAPPIFLSPAVSTCDIVESSRDEISRNVLDEGNDVPNDAGRWVEIFGPDGRVVFSERVARETSDGFGPN